MITATVNTDGLNAVISRLKSVDSLRDRATVTPLLDEMMRTMYEDNRRGVMAGQDKDGKPAPPLRYRNAAAIQSGARSRSSGAFGVATRINTVTGRGMPRGAAPARLNAAGNVAILPNNNLPTKLYQRLTGPRLAPRRDQSRVIANYGFRPPKQMTWGWLLTGYWANVLTPKGRQLLPMHFDATRPGMKYDLRGVRPWGLERCRHLAKSFVLRLLAAGA